MKNAHLTAHESIDALPAELVGLDADPISEDRPSKRHTPVQDRYVAGNVVAGKYRIINLLGEGGMGAVWRAHSLTLDVDVAIKVLHREHAAQRASARLLREARATASIGHPSIVQVFDFGKTEAGEPFLVMELLAGESLAGWIDSRGRMSATQAVQMLLPIASALVAAHARGIVHRDIKPENIVAVPNGPGSYLPKIVDFGVAKLLSDNSGPVLTEAGMILGSLEYMSPEQAEGQQEVGEQTDVWALCVVLYELITGRRPFHGSTATATIFALYTRDPTPTTQFAAGDEELWAILQKGFQKSPVNRWPTMLSLGKALAAWAIERGITVDAAGASIAHHWLPTDSDPPAAFEPAEHAATATTTVGRPSPRASSIDLPASPRTEIEISAEAEPEVKAETTAQSPRIEPPGSSSPPPRFGTIELAYPLERRSNPSLPVRRARMFHPAALLAIVLVPMAILACLFAGVGSAKPRDEVTVPPIVVAPTPAPEPREPVTPASIQVQPEPILADTVAPSPVEAQKTAPPVRIRDKGAPPKAPSKPSRTPMPLPSVPNF